MAVMRERTRARQQCCCEQQHSKLHGLDLSMDAVMDRTLAIDPLFRRAHRTCAAGDRSVTWRRLKRACAGARSPTRRARARAATDRRRGFAAQRRSQVPAPHCRAPTAMLRNQRSKPIRRIALPSVLRRNAAFVPREERRELRACRGRCGLSRNPSLSRRLRSGSTGTRAGSRRSRRCDCRSAARSASGMLPASSIVRYEMQRRASSSYGATIAPVGHAVDACRARAAMRTDAAPSRAAADRCRSRRERNTSPCRASAAACACRASPVPSCAASATSSTGALSVNTR